MAARIEALTAAGGQSWRWQLRDRNGRWIEMGAKVKWFAQGLARTGLVVGSPQPGEAEVEESSSKRRLRIAANRLTVLANKAETAITSRKGGREEGGALNLNAVVGRRRQQKAAPSTGSQPEPDTVPDVPEEVAGSGMPQEQQDRLSQGVNWNPVTGDSAEKTNVFRKAFELIRGQRTEDGRVRPGRPDGAGTEEDPIYVGQDLDRARALLVEGKHIRLESRQDLNRLLTTEFADMIRASKTGTLNMCLVTVPDTSLFCEKDKDVTRDWMPQLSGKDADTGADKDVQPWAEEMLEGMNLIGAIEEADPNTLAASQSELKTEQIIGMKTSAKKWLAATQRSKELRDAGKTAQADALDAEIDAALNKKPVGDMMRLEVLTAPILVTDDGYIIDGHHRWAAAILLNEELKSEGFEPVPMQVRKVKMEIGEALSTVNAFADAAGIARKSGGAGTAEMPEILRASKPSPAITEWISKNMPKILEQLGPDPSKWGAVTKAKKKQVRSRRQAVAASIDAGDYLILDDDSERQILTVLAETYDSITVLLEDPESGEHEIAIMPRDRPFTLERAS